MADSVVGIRLVRFQVRFPLFVEIASPGSIYKFLPAFIRRQIDAVFRIIPGVKNAVGRVRKDEHDVAFIVPLLLLLAERGVFQFAKKMGNGTEFQSGLFQEFGEKENLVRIVHADVDALHLLLGIGEGVVVAPVIRFVYTTTKAGEGEIGVRQPYSVCGLRDFERPGEQFIDSVDIMSDVIGAMCGPLEIAVHRIYQLLVVDMKEGFGRQGESFPGDVLLHVLYEDEDVYG